MDEEQTTPIPLTSNQRRLWLLHQIESPNTAHNVSACLVLQGQLDISVLQNSLTELVNHQPVLRTTYDLAVDGQPVAYIPAVSTGVPKLMVHDLSKLLPSEQEEAKARLLAELSHVAIDLKNGPVLFAHLLCFSATVHHLLLIAHPIVIDGDAWPIVLRELATLYEEIMMGQSPQSNILPYADYVRRQAKQQQDGTVEADLAYWQTQLAGELTVLTLPTDAPRPSVQTYRGAKGKRPLPAPLTQAIQQVSQVTPFVLLLSTFQVLLARYSRQQEILVGTPVHYDTPFNHENMLGSFLNTIVLHTDLSQNPSFSQLATQLQQQWQAGLAHKNAPFETLVERVQIERDLSRSPLVQAMFVMDEQAQPPLVVGGMQWQLFPLETNSHKADLMLTVQTSGPQWGLTVDYNADLFAPATIDQLLVHFEQLLMGMITDPNQPVFHVPMLRPDESAHLLHQSRAHHRPNRSIAHTIPQRLEAWVQETPSAIALVEGNRSWTYQQLNEQANQWAHYLQAQGVQQDDVVGIYMPRSATVNLAMMGILKAGATYLPLDPTHPETRIAYMVQNAGANIVLGAPDIAGRLSTSAQIMVLDEQVIAEGEFPTTPPPRQTQPDSLACLIYTSGSTGQPKGVMTTHRNIFHLFTDFTFDTSTRMAYVANTAFDAATFEIWGALLNGGCLVVIPQDDALSNEQLAATIEQQQINSALFTTARFNQLVYQIPETLNCFKTIFFGGEAADLAVCQHAKRTIPNPMFINAYGPTEITVMASMFDLAQLETDAVTVPIGRPLPDTALYILDDYLNPVPRGVVGELYVGGNDGVARGYFQRPFLTADRFIPDPFSQESGARLYRTGDLVRLRADNNIEFVGRADHQVKLRGFRIELSEISYLLSQYPNVQDSHVMLRQETAGQPYLAAYVASAQSLSEVDIRAFLQKSLPAVMVPRTLTILPAFPLTPNGKLDVRGLPVPEQTAVSQTITPPRTPVETILTTIWQQELNMPQVGIFADFFALGGHSLLGVKLLTQIKEKFAVSMRMSEFFMHTTIAQQAAFIEKARKTDQNLLVAPIKSVAHNRVAPLSSAQKRMWILYKLAPQDPTYNIPFVLRMNGRVNKLALEKALNAIVCRHAVLRTTYDIRQGEPISIVHPHIHVPLRLHDMSHLPENQREPAARQYVQQRAMTPFNLTQGPLFHMELVRLQEEQHVLLLNTHHIAIDGWSINIFAQEMAHLYRASLADVPSTLPDMPVQYADYAIWQQNWLNSDAFQAQLAYWATRLEPLRGQTPYLPTDHTLPRDPHKQSQGKVYEWAWDEPFCQQLLRFARQMGCTPYMMMLAGFQLLLHQYSGDQHIAVGSPIANRNQSETTNMLGFFVNTLVLVADFGAVQTFRDLLQTIRQETLGAFDRQEMPFDELVKAFAQKGRDTNTQPFFRAMFNFKRLGNDGQEPLDFPDLEVAFAELDATTAMFDLLFEGGEENGRFIGKLHYRQALFEPETICTIIEHLQTVMAQVIADPDQPLATYSVWSEAVQAEWAQTAVALQTHPAIQQAQVQAWHNRPNPKSLTAYMVAGSVQPTAQQLTAYLQQKGVHIPANFIFVPNLDSQALPPPTQPEEQPAQLEAKRQAESAKANLANKKAALSNKKRALLNKMLSKAKNKQKKTLHIQPRPDDGAPIPLSFAQERLWFLQQFRLTSTYNMPLRFDLPFAVDKEILEKCVRTILERHAILRTTFVWDGERPTQQINPVPDQLVTVADLSQADDPEQAWREVSNADAKRPFDFAIEHPFRSQLVKMAEAHYRLILNVHHIAFDGWSWGVFMREFGQLYLAYSQNKPNPLPQLPIQYADFAVWQRNWLQGDVLEKQISYWRDTLNGLPPSLDLPTDYPRPAQQTFAGGFIAQEILTGAEYAQLQRLSREEDVSVFMILLTVFNILLYRYTRQQDIAVGTPISNRPHSELEGLVGFFVNTLVMRTQIDPQQTFQSLLKMVHEIALGAYDHQDVPFEQLVEQIQPERDMSRSPLFQVMLAFQNIPTISNEGQLQWAPLGFDRHVARFELTLNLIPLGKQGADGVLAELEYNKDLFAHDRMARMLGHMTTLFRAILSDPAQQIAQLPLLTATEQTQIQQWNQTQTEIGSYQSLADAVRHHAQVRPNHLAVMYENQTLTYAEFDRYSNQLANYLQAQGVGLESLVGLCVEKSIEMLVGVVGIHKAGGAYVPIDPSYPDDRIHYMVEDARIDLLLTQRHLLPSLQAIPVAHIVPIDGLVGQAWADSDPLTAVHPDNLAYIIYTSGSTGKPKGVQVPHRGVLNLMQAEQEIFQLPPETRILQFASFSFDSSVHDMVMTWSCGGTLVLAKAEDLLPGPKLVNLLREKQINVATIMPSAVSAMPFADLPDWHTLVVGGEACSQALVDRWGRDRRIVNVYGPTEISVWGITAHLQPEQSLAPPIGVPSCNMQAHILDVRMRPVPVGVVGDLYIGGLGVTRGYLNRAGLTAERYLPDPFSPHIGARLYKTGDLAKYRANGQIEFLGRVDTQVKVRGYRIELGEIERVLRTHEAVNETAVIVRQDEPDQARLVAYVIAQADVEVGPNQLRHYLRQTLPTYMIPSAFIFMEAFPQTTNNKLDIRALPASEMGGTSERFVPPQTDVEIQLAKIWQALLEVEKVGLNDNFFELGGHSLLATQLMTQIEEHWHIEVTLPEIFNALTLGDLAEIIVNKLIEETDEEELDDLLAQMDDLSDEEIDALLADSPEE